jgi:DNA-directed RNA polymerase subunit M/transcription elongation factor TFIIS
MMHCPKCNGLLYVEKLAYAHTSLACLNCGNRIDPVILENRRMTPSTDSAFPRLYPIPIIVSP